MQRNKVFIMLGIVLLLAAGVWRFAIGSSSEQRIPDDWSWESSYVGNNNFVPEGETDFPEELTFPEDDPLNVYDRSISITNSNEDTVTLLDNNVTRDVNTGAVTWEFKFNAEVDRNTGQITDGDFKGHYFVFPRNVEQKSYTLTHTSYHNILVDFVGEEEIEGLNTYLFRHASDYEYTFAYASTDDYAGLDVEENQEIRCPEMEINYWVEPLTGEIVKVQEGCSWDAVFDTTNGEVLYKLSRWYGASTIDDTLRQVNEIKSERNSILMNSFRTFA